MSTAKAPNGGRSDLTPEPRAPALEGARRGQGSARAGRRTGSWRTIARPRTTPPGRAVALTCGAVLAWAFVPASEATLTLLFPPSIRGDGGGFDKAIETALPRVVKLYGLGVGRQAGYGTGVLVSPDGLVLTVFSLLIDARQIRTVTADGTRCEAEVVHRDPQRQLALLRLKAPDGDEAGEGERGDHDDDTVAGPFPYFDIGCAGAGESPSSPGDLPPCDGMLQAGDWVLTAGNPFKVAEGSEPVSIAHGVFSTRTRLDARRQVKDFPYRGEVLVIDAITSNPGAPGSAVVNLDGAFVGMIGRVVTSNLTHTHFNYAMPREVLYDYLREATAPARAADKEASPPPVSHRDDGGSGMVDPGIRLARTGYLRIPPLVERVQRDSPAERAGIRKDDLILTLNGWNVADVAAYDDRLAGLASDEPIDLVVRRGRRILTIRIEPSKPAEEGTKP